MSMICLVFQEAAQTENFADPIVISELSKSISTKSPGLYAFNCLPVNDKGKSLVN